MCICYEPILAAASRAAMLELMTRRRPSAQPLTVASYSARVVGLKKATQSKGL